MKYTTTVALILGIAMAQTQDSPATRRLKSRFPEYEKAVLRVSPSVHIANGYTVSTTAVLEGPSGLVIIDPGQTVNGSAEIRREFSRLSSKPIRAIIYTHGHPDHTGGARAFVDAAADIEIWARAGFGSEAARNAEVGFSGPIRRADTQGFDLPPAQRVGIGIAMPPDERPAGNIMTGGGARGAAKKKGGGGGAPPGAVPPTHTFSEDRRKLNLAGLDLELVAAPGETADHLYVWFPAERVLFAGDNFYKSWPNVYPLRGTARRSTRDWIRSYDRMIAENPLHLVGGHSRPILNDGRQMLIHHRDALKYVHDETIRGASNFMTPDELVASIHLPAHLAAVDSLTEFYGSIEGTIRDIYAQDLGWFDGDPLNLHRESPRRQSERMAEIAGGVDALLARARQSLAKGDPLGAAQLAQHVVRLRPGDKAAKILFAEALAILGERTLNAPARNYTLGYANLLRSEAEGQ